MSSLAEYPHAMGSVAPRELKVHHINSPKEAANYTEKELLAIHGVGPKAVRILKELLAEHGLALKTEVSKS